MKTGTILTFGGVVLLGFGLLGGIAFLFPLLGGKHVFSDLLAVLILGAAPAAAGFALIGAGRRKARLEQQTDEQGFSETVIALAKKNGGTVALEQVTRASGLLKEEAQKKMRELCARGLFELDFDAGGQMSFKLSPDAGRAQLAELAERR